MTHMLSLPTVDHLKDFNIVSFLPRRHRHSHGIQRKSQNTHQFIVASFNRQSMKGNDKACKCCEISSYVEDNGVDHICV